MNVRRAEAAGHRAEVESMSLQDNRTVTEQAHRHSSPCVCVRTEFFFFDTLVSLLSQTPQSTLRSVPMRHVCKAVSCVYGTVECQVLLPGCLQNTRYNCPGGRRHASHAARQDRTLTHPGSTPPVQPDAGHTKNHALQACAGRPGQAAPRPQLAQGPAAYAALRTLGSDAPRPVTDPRR